MAELDIGKAVQVRSGKEVAILNFGALLSQALAAAEQLNATVVDMRWVKPMDEEMLLAIAQQYSIIVTLEENAVAGGAGSAVNEFMAAQGLSPTILNLGIPDTYIEHGSHGEQLAWAGLDAQSIEARVRAIDRHTGEQQAVQAGVVLNPVMTPR